MDAAGSMAGFVAASYRTIPALVVGALYAAMAAPVAATTLLVSSATASHVFEFDVEAATQTQIFADSVTSKITRAFGAAYGSDGTVYITSESDDIVTFAPGRGFQGVLNGDLDSRYRDPRDLVFGPDGRLYSGTANQGLWVFDPSNGEVLDTIGGINDSVFGLTFGSDGLLYTANAFEDRVMRFNPVTRKRVTFIPAGASVLDFPTGLEFGPDDNLYVTSRLDGGGGILRFNGTTGAFIDTFITGLLDPYDVAFGPDGLLYVSEGSGTGKVKRYSAASGEFVDIFI